jgi:hypothetical protein
MQPYLMLAIFMFAGLFIFYYYKYRRVLKMYMELTQVISDASIGGYGQGEEKPVVHRLHKKHSTK